ncbi:HAD-IIIA family hydrolase [bacterium]|nr:HAD-IIIA family hydrolase [bacterium]
MTRWPDIEPPARDATPRPTLFLDRDGCLNVDRDYLADPAQVELVPGAAGALRRARAAGYRLIGVSNQSGLGRGRFARAELDAVMTRLDELLRAADAPLDAFYYCPHAPQDGCACRKPRTGLLDEAAREFFWDPARSWVIGDKVSDVDLARAAGLRGILVLTGHGADERRRLVDREGVLVRPDLAAAIATALEDRP